MARSDKRRRCQACDLPAVAFEPGSEHKEYLPWNALVRGRTHKGKPVYICARCKTPVERKFFRFAATPAAVAAFNISDGSIIEIECKLRYRPMPTYGGELPGVFADGKTRLFEWSDSGLDEELASAYYVAYLHSQKPDEQVAEARGEVYGPIIRDAVAEAVGTLPLPAPERAVKDWEPRASGS